MMYLQHNLNNDLETRTSIVGALHFAPSVQLLQLPSISNIVTAASQLIVDLYLFGSGQLNPTWIVSYKVYAIPNFDLNLNTRQPRRLTFGMQPISLNSTYLAVK